MQYLWLGKQENLTIMPHRDKQKENKKNRRKPASSSSPRNVTLESLRTTET